MPVSRYLTPCISPPAGLNSDAGVFFFHYFAVYILALVYVSIGTFLSTAMPTFEVAQALLGIIAPLLFLFGGLWSPPSQMAPGCVWCCAMSERAQLA